MGGEGVPDEEDEEEEEEEEEDEDDEDESESLGTAAAAAAPTGRDSRGPGVMFDIDTPNDETPSNDNPLLPPLPEEGGRGTAAEDGREGGGVETADATDEVGRDGAKCVVVTDRASMGDAPRMLIFGERSDGEA